MSTMLLLRTDVDIYIYQVISLYSRPFTETQGLTPQQALSFTRKQSWVGPSEVEERLGMKK